MMHMWVWLGYDVGELLFQGLNVVTKGAFAGACIVLFFVAFFFEGSKIIVARTQRSASRKLYPHKRADERHNLLWETQAATATREAGPSRNLPHAHPTISSKIRILINLHQTVVYLAHNTVGYILMLVVMIYNLYLMLAVVLGMVAGYFVFGPMLTKLQMECFRRPHGSNCTAECDDNAEGTTPPLMHTSLSSESDFFICQTPSCAQPSRYTQAAGADRVSPEQPTDTKNCYFGAKSCPSKVAVAKRLLSVVGPTRCSRDKESDKDTESQSVEDAKLLTEKSSCCKHSTPPEPVTLEPIVRVVNTESSCCSSKKQKPSSREEAIASRHPSAESQETGSGGVEPTSGADDHSSSHDAREDSPQISCCHNAKLAPSESQESIM